ncbi:unnamed protein product [Caenorhabditis angaria]|uniref:Uncharacterized protein n=1 Tax=Caenorhabditis angaria TaxID=860376 RepID=A0A9P1IR10_9PELO|nr:unnamed protein product [Caenorhabditis angaria]
MRDSWNAFSVLKNNQFDKIPFFILYCSSYNLDFENNLKSTTSTNLVSLLHVFNFGRSFQHCENYSIQE